VSKPSDMQPGIYPAQNERRLPPTLGEYSLAYVMAGAGLGLLTIWKHSRSQRRDIRAHSNFLLPRVVAFNRDRDDYAVADIRRRSGIW
jgi:hypothetical protein